MSMCGSVMNGSTNGAVDITAPDTGELGDHRSPEEVRRLAAEHVRHGRDAASHARRARRRDRTPRTQRARVRSRRGAARGPRPSPRGAPRPNITAPKRQISSGGRPTSSGAPRRHRFALLDRETGLMRREAEPAEAGHELARGGEVDRVSCRTERPRQRQQRIDVAVARTDAEQDALRCLRAHTCALRATYVRSVRPLAHRTQYRRTCVRVHRRSRFDHPCGPRLVLHVGQQPRSPPPAGQAGGSSAAGSCSPPATRPRPTASTRRWEAGRRARQMPRTLIEVPPRISTRTSRPARPCSRSSGTPRPWWRGISIDGRSSTSSGLRRIAGSPRGEYAVELRRDGSATEVGLAISVGIAGTKFLAKVARTVGQARRAARGAPSAPELGLPAPAARRAAVGCRAPAPRRSSTHAASPAGSARWRTLHREATDRGDARPGPRVTTSTRSPTTRTRAPPVVTGRRMRSMGSQQALGHGRPARRPTSTRCSSGWWTGWRAAPAGRRGLHGRTVVLRIRFGDFTADLPLPHAAPRRRPAPNRSSRRCAPSCITAHPLIDQRGITLVGMSVGNLDDGITQLVLPLDDAAGSTLDARARRRPRPLRYRRGHAARVAARPATQASTVPLLPD